MAAAPQQQSLIPMRLLGACSLLLLLAICYNSMEGWKAQSKGGRPAVREAALPLQRRMRKSRFVEDTSAEPIVIPEHFKQGVKLPSRWRTKPNAANTAAAALPGATGAGYRVGPNG
eukprot:CAMPEP_0184390626 /NCGR_PEP_ID=MMETSP0007-20130409/13456_1 /TAXON_ID=97485 /ORGANISM="Prymnesium parvum, Strain Texoma1" /LENGTH=115 /DNA_ID=CAMNT_0026740437 /DNA_START=8 /DNA_END=352 /DNA_ORIENTATION=-